MNPVAATAATTRVRVVVDAVAVTVVVAAMVALFSRQRLPQSFESMEVHTGLEQMTRCCCSCPPTAALPSIDFTTRNPTPRRHRTSHHTAHALSPARAGLLHRALKTRQNDNSPPAPNYASTANCASEKDMALELNAPVQGGCRPSRPDLIAHIHLSTLYESSVRYSIT
jgi:hypothetical protein